MTGPGVVDPLRRSDLKELVAVEGRPCVSIYLPTHTSGPDTRQDAIRLRNLITRARELLGASGLGAREAGALLRPAEQLVDDTEFWRFQSRGLAVFLDGGARVWRLPRAFDERVEVSRRFWITPLLPLLAADRTFHLLALSANHVRLFRADGFGIEQFEPDGLPTSLADVQRGGAPERQLQWHSRTSTVAGRRSAMFHGHGEAADARDEDLLRFARAVHAVVHDATKATSAPLVLAGEGSLLAIYRKVASSQAVMHDAILGNADDRDAESLRAQAWEIVEQVITEERARAAEDIPARIAAGRGVEGVERPVRAAARGLVETLFVTDGATCWGRWAADDDAVSIEEERAEGSEDLVDLAAVLTLRAGGDVHAFAREQMPVGSPLAAVLRSPWVERATV